jgi:site-specific recombinase XerD
MPAKHLSLVDEKSPNATPDAALIKEFIAQADVADTTKTIYRAHTSEFSRWLSHARTRRAGGPCSLLDARRADVARFMAYLLGGDRYTAPNSPRCVDVPSASTRKAFLASLRKLYRYLLTVELVDTDPTVGIDRPKVRTSPGFRLTAEEVRKLLDARGTPRCRVQAYLLAFTAARTNEIRCLRWRDVNLSEGTLTLHGKGDKYRILDIHPRLMPELRRWKLHQDALAERDPLIAAARSKPETDFVLLTRSGKQLAPNAIYKQLMRRAATAGLYVLDSKHREHRSKITPHALRRTFATLLLNEGHHLDAVADVLGHESLDTTRKHYAFSSDERRRSTIEAFDV